MEFTKGEWGDTQLKIDLRNILRGFYGEMKEVEKANPPEFNKGLDGICAYDEAIEKILERTAAPDMYEALTETLHRISLATRDCVEIGFSADIGFAQFKIIRALAKADGKEVK